MGTITNKEPSDLKTIRDGAANKNSKSDAGTCCGDNQYHSFCDGFNAATDIVFDRIVDWVKSNTELYKNDDYAMSILMLVDRLKENKDRILK